MRLGILGCGYVSEFYLGAIARRAELAVAGLYDRDASRMRRAGAEFGHAVYPSLESMLADPRIDTIVNLTPPDAHFETSRLALLANKHVYSEKPLTLDLAGARTLLALAGERRRHLCSAPATLLGPTAQTLWHALRRGLIGVPKVVYAELDDGPVHFKNHGSWRGRLDVPWPHVSEFATGCTMEHAAYYLTWLTAFFGPVRRVTAVSRCLYPDKDMGPDGPPVAPDLSIGCLELQSGVVARLTCGLAAPTDHSFTIVGDQGVLRIADGWDVFAPIAWRRRTEPIHRWPDKHLAPAEEIPLLRSPEPVGYKSSHKIDFAAGLVDMAEALAAGRAPRLGPEHALHVLEVTLALQNAGSGNVIDIRSAHPVIEPSPWAR